MRLVTIVFVCVSGNNNLLNLCLFTNFALNETVEIGCILSRQRGWFFVLGWYC